MSNLNQIIYLDNNATTPIDPRVLKTIIPFFSENFANAASTHKFGITAFEAVKNARKQVAELIGADSNEIIFTSGATEAINLAIKGVAENYSGKGKHILTVSTEHPAVLDTCRYLETKGFEVTYLPVLSDGLIDLAVLEKALRADTILVSVMLANNETGVIQSIKDISEMAHKAGAIFLSDTTQAVGKIPVDVDDLGIDILCVSGHKIYGPKGVGALYLRQRMNRIKIPALIHGGGHERGLRSGTLNVPGIVGLGLACEISTKEMIYDIKKITKLRNILEMELLKNPKSFINGNQVNRIFNVTSICFAGIEANVIIGKMKNVAVSNGSACSSSIEKPSHVLKAMNLTDNEAYSTLRFSLGRFNDEEDVIQACKILKSLI
jgi:cysteine desulfurase